VPTGRLHQGGIVLFCGTEAVRAAFPSSIGIVVFRTS
jgi:hypothetical protein